jgi:hypothetical protein
MPRCHASRNALEMQLEVELSTQVTLKLVMSLKRHVYHYIHKSESKEANSVLGHMVDVPQLVIDAEDVGKQIQAAELIGPLTPQMDFTTATHRTYRCDHHKGPTGFAKDGFNHFYPINGTHVWNCSINDFDKLQALRRLQKDFDNGSEQVKFSGWSAFMKNQPDWVEFRKKLLTSSGAGDVLDDLEQAFQERFKKPKKNDIFAQAANMGGFSFSDDEDEKKTKSPARSRSNSVTGSDDGSYWSESD